MNALINKVAIITGASSGIGLATARLFAREGAQLVLGGRRSEALDELVYEIRDGGGTAFALAGDVREEAHAKALVELAMTTFGGLDVGVNNAGSIGEMGETPTVSFQGWQATLDTNLTSAFLAAKYQVPAMRLRGGGSLIFTSSFVGHTIGMPGMSAYAAAKSGLLGLTKTLAVEFGAEGIRVNALLPGGTETPAGPQTEEAKVQVAGLHALKRLARPEEIALSALYLASDASSFTTGTSMLVDGGISISRT